jgi:WD40 repeat protein
LASAGENQPIRLWDVSSGKQIRQMDGLYGDEALAWSPDGTMLASGNKDRPRHVGAGPPIRPWDVSTGKMIRQMGKHAEARFLAWSPDGKTLAAAADGTIHLFDPATGQELRQIFADGFAVNSVAWSPDSKTLASAGWDQTIRLWDPFTGTQLRQIEGHQKSVLLVSWSPDGKTLASGGWDRTIRLWDPDTGLEMRRIDTHHYDEWSVAWSPDGKKLASACSGELHLWEIATRKCLKTFLGGATSNTSSYAGNAKVAWSPDGTKLAWKRDDAFLLLDPVAGKEILSFQGHEATVYSACWSPDGKLVASASWDRTVRLWDPATGRILRTLNGHEYGVWSVDWSPDGKMLASASTSTDKTIRLWNPATGNTVRRIVGPEEGFKWVVWSPLGNSLASLSWDKPISLWDAATGKEIRKLGGEEDRFWKIAWSPDGKTLATAYGGEIGLWDPATGKVVRRIVSEDYGFESLAWSPDGKTLATASSVGPTVLWEVATGNEIRKLGGEEDHFWRIAWSPDGKMLASWKPERRPADPEIDRTPRSGAIRLWEIASAKEAHQFVGHDGLVKSLAWSPDGTRLVSASDDATLLIWAVGHSPNKPATPLQLPDLKSCWTDLASDDGAKAYQAIWTLTQGHKDSLPFLAERLQPVAPADPKEVARLIEALDSNDFAIRQKATEELAAQGERVKHALRQTLANNPALEVRKRIEKLLEKLEPWSGERLRARRATTVLEYVGTAEARKLLEGLVKGVPEAQLTEEAKASLERLARRARNSTKATMEPASP